MAGYTEAKFVKQYEPGNQDRVELVHGRIVDVVHGCYYDAGTRIILQGDQIEALPGLAGEPADVQADCTIDLQGKTVLPGLFNTHCHLLQFESTFIPGLSDMRQIKRYREQQIAKNLADCLARGITHVRDAWHPDLSENRALKEQISRGEIPGPRIQQSVVVGPVGSYMQERPSLALRILGVPHVDDPSTRDAGAVAFATDATEQEVRDAVDVAIDERGADAIKILDEPYSFLARKPVPVMTVEQLCALTDQARCRGVQSTMHHTTVESFRRGTKAGVSSLAHAPIDALLTPGDVEAFKASGGLNDSTVSAIYAILSWKVGKARSNGHPELDRLTQFRDKTYTFDTIADEYYLPELRASVLSGYKKCASGKPKMMGIMDMSANYEWSEKTSTWFENFRLLHEHGVPMTTANDNKPPCTPAMMDLELLMMDHLLKGDPGQAPLSGVGAVQIATINSARSLGLEASFGSIEKGKTADLVILDGDPLADFRAIGSRVAALFMDGKLVINNCGLEVACSGQLPARL